VRFLLVGLDEQRILKMKTRYTREILEAAARIKKRKDKLRRTTRHIFAQELYRALKLDVLGSVHRNINLMERTNKMQPCSRIYYSSVS
jgi:hypothetical protein